MRYIKSYNNTADLRTDLAVGELGHPYVAKVNNTIDFDSISTNWENEYFTIIALTDGTIRYSHKNGSNPMFLSINEGEWIETTVSLDIPVFKNDMIRFKSNRGNKAYDNNKGTFTSGGTAQFAVAGNLMSLVAGDGFATYVPYTSATGSNGDLYRSFRYFFKYCTGLISAKNLIIKYCDKDAFREFFNGCTNLLMPPELPATTLANYCYSKMFGGCASLTAAPELPATTLADACYQNMFNGCVSLTKAPELPTETLTNNCYAGMFYGCTSVTTAPKLPATTLTNGCYSGMFRGCTSLTTAPELPATTLPQSCYANMFQDCTSLNYIKCLATDISASNCTGSWVDGVASTGTFVKNPNMASWTTDTNGIPTGWTVIDA